MDQEDIEELHDLINEWGMSKGYKTHEMLAFFTCLLVGNIEMHGYSQEFMNETCDRMKKQFMHKRQRNKALHPNDNVFPEVQNYSNVYLQFFLTINDM